MKNKIAVMGGGNGAHAMAADLAIKGFEVNMCEAPEFRERFKTTSERGEIDLIDPIGQERTAKLHKATIDVEEALKGVGYVMVVIPAFGHKRFFDLIMPHLEDGQHVVAWPGNYASLLFANMLRQEKMKRNIILAEASTLPYAARLIAPSRVRILSYALSNSLAAFPGKDTGKVIHDLKDVLRVAPSENVLGVAIANINYALHPVGSILNVGHIETLKSDYRLYRDGMTASVLRVIKAVYEEAVKLQQALGVTSYAKIPDKAFESIEELMQECEGIPGIALSSPEAKEFIRKAFASATEPSSMQSRYVTEDVPYGLVPTALLANKLGVHTPIINSIIELSSVVNQTNYWKKGRSLEELGIATLSKEELKNVLQEGF